MAYRESRDKCAAIAYECRAGKTTKQGPFTVGVKQCTQEPYEAKWFELGRGFDVESSSLILLRDSQ